MNEIINVEGLNKMVDFFKTYDLSSIKNIYAINNRNNNVSISVTIRNAYIENYAIYLNDGQEELKNNIMEIKDILKLISDSLISGITMPKLRAKGKIKQNREDVEIDVSIIFSVSNLYVEGENLYFY